MTTPISVNELQAMLLDLEVPDKEIARYLQTDYVSSRPFAPEIVIAPEAITESAEEAALLLGSLNGISRWRRQRKYRRKIARGWDGLTVISEGDSWFQYPFLLEDVIDQLFEDYAILSFGAAGDVLSNMVEQDEVSNAIREENADVFLISGGGNDLLGEGALRSYLRPFAPGREPADYIGDRFATFLRGVTDLYSQLFDRLISEFPQLRLICHGYDYAIPAGGRWLGKPMEHKDLRIADPDLQRRIIREIVDRMNGALQMIADDSSQIHLIDCRTAVPDDQWHDELHPTDVGYTAVAKRFREVIDG